MKLLPMKNALKFILYLLAINTFAQNKKTEILVLGTTHLFAIKDDSITSPKKAAELKYLLSKLKAFNPQQIFVESSAEDDGFFLKIQHEIDSTKKETIETWLLNNEYYQIGIKLAQSLNIKKGIQGIDWADLNTQDTTMVFKTKYEKAYFNFVKELRAFAAIKKYEAEDKESEKLFEEMIKPMMPYFSLNKKIGLVEMYKFLNSPENLKKSYYLNRMGNLLLNSSGVGAELNSFESFRDFKIFRIALNRIEKDSKRVLIIYGSGHAHILREQFELDSRYKVVELSQYLK
jgi:Family of unknown function (DUF5694)